jgi:hypothetical protein
MARKIILDTAYTFNAATRTITLPVYVPRERLILITNVTANKVVYNFSDPSLRATTYTSTVAADGVETTNIVLHYDTSAMSNTDKLQVTIDEYTEKFEPSETILDPVNKLRVSQPEALIDTDFEFGTQITKWENLAMVNNRPSSYPVVLQIPNITSIAMPTGSTEVTVTTGSAHGITVGTPITVLDTYLVIANGNFIVESVTTSSPHTFTYTSYAQNSTSVTEIFDPQKSSVSRNAFYTGAQIGGAPSAMTYAADGAITVTTSQLHCLALGNEISVTGTTASTNAPNGNFYVARIISPTQFVYYVTDVPTGTIGFGSAAIFNRQQSLFMHRPFDGGVFFSCNGSSANQQAIRQTRRYFRYQSGKGIQMSSGTVLKPTFQLDSLASSGTRVTVITKERHNLEPGAEITVTGANESAYNGEFLVDAVIDPVKFQYIALSAPSETTASGDYQIAVSGWYGGANRIGMFDGQNGLFWEYDGRTLFACQRSSTYQLSGKVSVTNGSNVVTQSNPINPTAFAKQLEVGDYVVIRGQSYRIQDIASDTSMTVSPAYRGGSASFVNISKTLDSKVPQSEFNIDKVDGTGPSGYNIDLTKMQMFYIDYTWYGAGFVRYGVRGPRGDVIYVHKQPNNNINAEAYMRSGNLPARYEANTMTVMTKLTATLSNTETATLNLADTSQFPPAGLIMVRNDNTYEYINYTGKTATTLTGLTRAKAGAAAQTVTMSAGATSGTVASTTGLQWGQRAVSTGFPDTTYIYRIEGNTIKFSQAATATNPTVIFPAMGATTPQTFTFSSVDPIIVELASPTFGPSINHWGTSVIMDGRFDADKSLIFTYGQTTTTNIANNASKALMSIRLAPSVDNGLTATFGGRELINRMQLTLDEVGVSTRSANANLLVRLYINGVPSTATPWTNAVGNVAGLVNSSLAQIADYAGGNTTVAGGEVTGGLFIQGTDRIDLDNVRDLGNSIMGGGGPNANTQIYPDGPDVLTVVVTNLSGGSVDVLGRISWTEAQA